MCSHIPNLLCFIYGIYNYLRYSAIQVNRLENTLKPANPLIEIGFSLSTKFERYDINRINVGINDNRYRNFHLNKCITGK